MKDFIIYYKDCLKSFIKDKKNILKLTMFMIVKIKVYIFRIDLLKSLK